MRSIQTKFIVLILSCVLLCAVVIGGGAIVATKRVIDADSAQLMNLQCREGVEKFNNRFSRMEQSVKTLSVFALEELDDVEKLKTDEAYLKAYTQRLESVAVNAAGNTEGALAVYVRFNPDFTPPNSGLFWSKTNSNGYFQRLEPTDFSSYSPEDVEHVGWYYIPVKKGKPMWMSPYLNQNINVRMVSYVIPLYKGNEVIGVVGMDIDFGVFESLAKDMNIYETGYAFLCDEEGSTMYHPQYALDTKLYNIETSLRPVVEELKNRTSAGSLFEYELNGQKKRMAYRTLENGMLLAITAPLHEIDAVKNKLIIHSIIAIVLICVLSVILTISLTKRLTRPLRELNDAAQKIAGGDLNISLSQPSKDEVGMLADSFQQTVNELQKHISYINGLAYRDALTGVKNKMAYQEVERQMEEKMKFGQPQFAVVVFDINNLKITNDRYGHDFGDMLIIDCCRFICKIFKHSAVYRIGGDEFAVILENAELDNYVQLLEDFAVGLVEQNKQVPPDNRISIARGVAIYNSDSDLVFANVFKRADDAMYQNKAMMKERELVEKQKLEEKK